MSKIDQARLNLMDRYWKAANYLTVGQIYLQDNPLLKEPLRPEHIKPRLLGHWGTSPGLSFIYVHLNRLIKDHNVNMIYLAGPGHGGPAILANVYLEGTYTEIYPEISQNTEGIRRPLSPVLNTWRHPKPCKCSYHPAQFMQGGEFRLCPGSRHLSCVR